jgi:hypothetical protein
VARGYWTAGARFLLTDDSVTAPSRGSLVWLDPEFPTAIIHDVVQVAPLFPSLPSLPHSLDVTEQGRVFPATSPGAPPLAGALALQWGQGDWVAAPLIPLLEGSHGHHYLASMPIGVHPPCNQVGRVGRGST